MLVQKRHISSCNPIFPRSKSVTESRISARQDLDMQKTAMKRCGRYLQLPRIEAKDEGLTLFKIYRPSRNVLRLEPQITHRDKSIEEGTKSQEKDTVDGDIA